MPDEQTLVSNELSEDITLVCDEETTNECYQTGSEDGSEYNADELESEPEDDESNKDGLLSTESEQIDLELEARPKISTTDNLEESFLTFFADRC